MEEEYKSLIESLRVRVNELEIENEQLKIRLKDNGISYEDICCPLTEALPAAYEPDQGNRIKEMKINQAYAWAFFEKFCTGRNDVYALRKVSKTTNKPGYYPQCDNRWTSDCPKYNNIKGVRCQECDKRAFCTLTPDVIEAHLLGKDPKGGDVVGIYPIINQDECRFLVFDFDNHKQGAEHYDFANEDDSWRKEINALRTICKVLGINNIVERSRSGRGAHLWIFFSENIKARLARRFGFALLEKGAEYINLKEFTYYDRMVPSQDALPKGGLGNLIALPLQGQALKQGNSAFVDENWNAYPEQWKALKLDNRLSQKDIESFIEKWRGEEKDSVLNHAPEDGPWNKGVRFNASDVKGTVEIILSDRIYVSSINMTNKMKRQIRRLATCSNKTYFINQNTDKPNYDNPMYYYLGSDEEDYIVLPRGLKEELCGRFDKAEIKYVIFDERIEGKKINVKFKGELKENQKDATKAILDNETGILHAATAFGKTVVCCNMIAEKGVNTLILVTKKSLQNQWVKELEHFLEIDEPLPTYKTKGGKEKQRKSIIGTLNGAKDTLTGIVDVAMIRSIERKGEFNEKLQDYGMVIMDECHHVASDTSISVLQEVKAKNVYGVTATPVRTDGKTKINNFLLGPIRYRYTSKDRINDQEGIGHYVYPRFTHTIKVDGSSSGYYGTNDYELLRNNDTRDNQIIGDIAECLKEGRTPCVLSRFVDHAKKLKEKLAGYADHIILLTGADGSKAQDQEAAKLERISPDESLILIGTSSLIGEGFNCRRLDTLFLVEPNSSASLIEQYAGRVNRDYDDKKDVIIYDYVDINIPKFENMYMSRLKTYKKIGYEVCSGIDGDKQQANAIYDPDNYSETYWEDLEEATENVVISSPFLSAAKVNKTIKILGKLYEQGVKVTIVTWDAGSYKYGEDKNRNTLLQKLTECGFNMVYVKDCCRHYAIIDKEIVWYGNMNLLSKENPEDNLMRVESTEIADELLELTFHKENR